MKICLRSDKLLPNHTLQFEAGDTGIPGGYMAIRKMSKMRDEQNVVAYIGPDNNCASEALIAAAWNIPMITYVSDHNNINII